MKSEKNKQSFCSLYTPFESDNEHSWDEYPRPQMKRDSFFSLCGEWTLFAGSENLGIIKVPFPPQSRISGIEADASKLEYFVYKKEFVIESSFIRDKVILHFGAVDQIALVYINGKKVGEHTGGYIPFSFDVTEYVKEGINSISVEVTDTLDTDIPYGKQRKNRGGMWYTPISGIWQPVWLESVPDSYISSIKIKPTLDSVTIDTVGGNKEKKIKINGIDSEYSYLGDSVTIKIDTPQLWSPEHPFLYEFSIDCGDDHIESYFALRRVDIKSENNKSYICLNNKPYFFHGILDQGYFSDGIYTPATPRGYIYDILTMKRLGFNTLRKHIKIEPELFYYYCDKYGMIVFQDMVNSGKYNFMLDTALPTVGLKRGISHKASKKRKELFENSIRETATLLYNHPSVCYYTIFNEGWGQYDADRIYSEMKSYDSTRIWDATSGWFTESKSDVQSEHVYFKKIDLKVDPNMPLVLSEFGGYSLPIEEHCFNLNKEYGYKSFKNKGELMSGIENLYTNEIIPMIKKGLCATVLTQVSDVEDEINGLVTYDRQVIKVDEKRMKRLSELLYKAFDDSIK